MDLTNKGDLEIDGRSIAAIMRGEPDARSPHEALYFWYRRGDLEAMRSGRWKLHFPHGYRTMEGRAPGNNGIPGKYDYSVSTGLELYDLSVDPNETTNVADLHPDVMDRLHAMSSAQRLKLGDSLNKIVGTDVREPGRLPEPDTN